MRLDVMIRDDEMGGWGDKKGFVNAAMVYLSSFSFLGDLFACNQNRDPYSAAWTLSKASTVTSQP